MLKKKAELRDYLLAHPEVLHWLVGVRILTRASQLTLWDSAVSVRGSDAQLYFEGIEASQPLELSQNKDRRVMPLSRC